MFTLYVCFSTCWPRDIHTVHTDRCLGRSESTETPHQVGHTRCIQLSFSISLLGITFRLSKGRCRLEVKPSVTRNTTEKTSPIKVKQVPWTTPHYKNHVIVLSVLLRKHENVIWPMEHIFVHPDVQRILIQTRRSIFKHASHITACYRHESTTYPPIVRDNVPDREGNIMGWFFQSKTVVW